HPGPRAHCPRPRPATARPPPGTPPPPRRPGAGSAPAGRPRARRRQTAGHRRGAPLRSSQAGAVRAQRAAQCPPVKPQAGTLLPAPALTTQLMPRTSATTPSSSAPQPGVEAARHPGAPCDAAGGPPETVTPAMRLPIAGPFTDMRMPGPLPPSVGPLRTWTPAYGAMRPWMVLRPAGRATRRVPAVRAGPGVSYRMISAVVALDTALPSVRGTPAAPRGTAPVPTGRRDRPGRAPDCGGLGWTLGPPGALAPPRFRGGVRQHRRCGAWRWRPVGV